jgi:hypothetical protein
MEYRMNAVCRTNKLRIVGVAFVIIAIVLAYINARHPYEYIGAAGALCLLWVTVFDRQPRNSNTIGDVYRSHLAGWRMSMSGKVMTLLGLLLLAVSFYMKTRSS